jgi:glycerol uptake facilitator-like aquaporin
MTLSRRLAAEALATAFLRAVVVGSGIMGERLAAGNAAANTLLANSIATGCGLWVLITMFGPISEAHFNPAVTLAFAPAGEFAWRDVLPYAMTKIAAAQVSPRRS